MNIMEIFYCLKESQSDPAAQSSYPAGLPASQPATGARCSGRWFPRRDRWLKKRRTKKQNTTFIMFKPTHHVISLHLLLFPVILNSLSTLCFLSELRCVGHRTILTLANRVLETSDAVNELSVLLQTRLPGRQGRRRRRRRKDQMMNTFHCLFGKEEDSERFLMKRTVMKQLGCLRLF